MTSHLVFGLDLHNFICFSLLVILKFDVGRTGNKCNRRRNYILKSTANVSCTITVISQTSSTCDAAEILVAADTPLLEPSVTCLTVFVVLWGPDENSSKDITYGISAAQTWCSSGPFWHQEALVGDLHLCPGDQRWCSGVNRWPAWTSGTHCLVCRSAF